MTPKNSSGPKLPMKLNLGKTALKINVSFAAVITMMLILDGSGMCAVGLFCCVIHEVGHIICLVVLGEKPESVEFSFYGIKLERSRRSSLTAAEEMAVYAAGPVMNFVFSAFMLPFSSTHTGIKTAAAISFCVGIFNLLPCRPLDGGNILSSFLAYTTDEEKAEKICFYTSCFVIVPMAVSGVAMIFANGNFTLAAVTAYLAWVTLKMK